MRYTGSCHCQAVKFECNFTLNQPVMCDCSYCAKRHAVLHIVDDLTILQGKDALTCYRFNKMKGQHYFCQHCSIFIYGSSPPDYPAYPFVINLCALDNCNWQHVKLIHFDGKSL